MTNILTAVMEAVGVKEGEEFKLAKQFKDADIIVIAAPFWIWVTRLVG